MTAIIVFASLIAVNVAYTVYDARRAETARQMDDFYRVEFKKTYNLNSDNVPVNGWH